MKKFWLISAAAAMTALLSVPALAATGEELLRSAAVYLTFEDGIEDANGNYSIYSDGDTPLVEGRFGSAANIQSGVNYLTVEEFLFESDSFTVTAWLNAHEHNGDPAIFATKSWAAGSNPGWILAMESQTIKYNANTADGSRTDGAFAYAASSMESDIDTWYHIALSVDREKETYTFYINGVAMGTGNFAENGHSDESYDDTDNGYTFNIGEDGTGFYNMSQTLDCDFDEIAVFKGKALTEEEIVSIYTYAPEGYEASVVTEKVLEPLTYTADPAEVLASADLHITFEDGAVDTTGHYTITSNGTTPSVEGISGKAANVTNGVNSLIVEDFAVGTDSFTVTSWLNLHALSGDPVIFGNKDWASGSNPGWLVCTADAIGGAKVSYNANVEAVHESIWAITFPLPWEQIAMTTGSM